MGGAFIDWIYLAQDDKKGRVTLNTVMKFWAL